MTSNGSALESEPPRSSAGYGAVDAGLADIAERLATPRAQPLAVGGRLGREALLGRALSVVSALRESGVSISPDSTATK